MLDDAHSHDMSETLPEAGVRDTLARLIQQSGEGFASLSRLIGRNPAYIQQYLKRGIPRRLSEQDRRRLARHFGVSEALFGAPVATLSPHAAAPDDVTSEAWANTAATPRRWPAGDGEPANRQVRLQGLDAGGPDPQRAR